VCDNKRAEDTGPKGGDGSNKQANVWTTTNAKKSWADNVRRMTACVDDGVCPEQLVHGNRLFFNMMHVVVQ
jgi:hypothetical protein